MEVKTLRDAVRTTLRVFYQVSIGEDKKIWHYAIKNERCVNCKIYFVAEDYILAMKDEEVEDFLGININDDYYTELFSDIYYIAGEAVKDKLPTNRIDEFEKRAANAQYLNYVIGDGECIHWERYRANIVMGTVLFLLETLDKEDVFNKRFVERLKQKYANVQEYMFGQSFYSLLVDTFKNYKDEPCWIADAHTLMEKSEYEQWHDEFVKNILGETCKKELTLDSIPTVDTQTDPNNNTLPPPCDSNIDSANEGEDARQEIPQDVKSCFKHPSEFTKEQVKKIVDNFYLGIPVNLALIEVVLFDHGQLYKRNQHKAFIRALKGWGILREDTDEGLTSNSMSTKLKRPFPIAGYKEWENKYLNDRTFCTDIGNMLDNSMRYER